MHTLLDDFIVTHSTINIMKLREKGISIGNGEAKFIGAADVAIRKLGCAVQWICL